MGVLFQGFYKMRPALAVPSPADGDPGVPAWWDHLAAQANELQRVGFSAVWLPPLLKDARGVGADADGYSPFDDYDIGSKNQLGTLSTRYGTREGLARCVATLRANGLDVYVDMVEHHRLGDNGDFTFRYRGADGTPDIGRFPKSKLNFLPNVPRDPNLGGPVADDRPFGRELAPINGLPPGYVFDNLVDAGDWLTRSLDVQGFRLDDVKGLSTDFLFPFLTRKAMAGKFAVGEFFDGNPALVNGWIFNPVGMRGRPSAFDFPLKFQLTAMCNGAGRFNMADLDHAGLAGTSPFNAVTFVENHDTDTDANAIVVNKMLGYAYILTSEGYPCVYYRDYSTDANCYGLKPFIDNLIWIHEKLAAGATRERWKDFNVFAYERFGGPGLLVGLNNDPGGPRVITVATAFGGNVRLHEYTGNGGTVATNPDGTVTLTIPRNQDGHGYVCYSREGVDGGFDVRPRAVTQVLKGARDLDILPALPDKTVSVQRIWCEASTDVSAALLPDTANFTAATRIALTIKRPDGQPLASKAYSAQATTEGPLVARTVSAGFHTLELAASNTPAANAAPAYELSVTYTAPRALALAPPPAQDPAVKGSWGKVFALPNVAIHAHLLPNGKVLFWGRREDGNDDLDVHSCTPQLWDPLTRQTAPTPQPKHLDGTTVNLFCSGHAFLPDGRLLVVGGHLQDSNGSNQACLYDHATNTWTPTLPMNEGRWYPTAVALPDGGVLASSGSVKINGTPVANDLPQVWKDDAWRALALFPDPQHRILPLFPRLHVEPGGRVFMSGALAESFFLKTDEPSGWTPLDQNPNGSRQQGFREYAPAVLYDEGKVLFIGGGNNQGTQVPTNIAELIDLKANPPVWHTTGAMHTARRQHNATLLPDGTVLVTGGTRGPGFNDLGPGEPVHAAEIWDPATGLWTELAAEDVDRCYHATALLLPDGTVLSAGGGEYRPDGSPNPNPPKDTHRDAQIFSPPYLFKGPRPVIANAPASVVYGQAFDVTTPDAAQIRKVSFIRLGSVTHSFDQNQRINFLPFTAGAGKLSVTPPPNANVCPPGHYLLFLVSTAGVPSVAKIVRIAATAVVTPTAQRRLVMPLARARAPLHTVTLDATIAADARGTRVTVGVTPTCPYGLGACWGGAYEALQHLSGVAVVRPIADAESSTATVYLRDESLPDIDAWPAEFARTANGTYAFRGVETTLRGVVQRENGTLWLRAEGPRGPVKLAPLRAEDVIQWDHTKGALRPMLAREQIAYDELAALASNDTRVTVTGPLRKSHGEFVLQVREAERAP